MTSMVVIAPSAVCVCVCCCVLAEVGKNDKYVGHFPELWFRGVKHSELMRGEKEQKEREHKESDRIRRGRRMDTKHVTRLYTHPQCMFR